jgi:hypothetical protein
MILQPDSSFPHASDPVDFGNLLISYSNAYQLNRQRDQNAITLGALASIYAKTKENNIKSNKRAEILKNIESDLTTIRTFSPDTLKYAPYFINENNNPVNFNPEDMAKSIGLGISVFGTVAGALSVPGALALTIAGTLAEPTLTYLSTPNLDLSHDPFLANTSNADLEIITQWALQSSLNIAAKDSNFHAFLYDPNTQSNLQINLSQGLADIANNLPPNIKQAISQEVAQDVDNIIKNPGLAKDLAASIKQGIRNSLAGLKNQADLIAQKQKEELSSIEKQRELQAAQADFERINREITGGIAIGTAFFKYILGDPDAAHVLQSVTGAAQKIYNAVNQFNIDQGILSLTGSFIGGAQMLFFAFGKSQDQEILETLAEIRKTLSQIVEQLNEIEHQQATIIEGLNKIFSTMQLNAAAAEALLQNLQSSLDQMQQDVNAGFRMNDEVGFGSRIDLCLSHIRRRTDPIHSAGFINQYNDDLAAFYSYAKRTSKKPTFAGNVEVQYDLSMAAEEIKVRKRVDLLFALIPQFGSLIATFPKEPSAMIEPLSNPLTWAQGVNAYLEARVLAADTVIADDKQWLPDLWNEGLRINSFTKNAGSYRFVQSASNAYKVAAGIDQDPSDSFLSQSSSLLGLLYRSLRQYENDQLTPVYSISAASSRMITNGMTAYSTGPFSSTFPVLVRNDPFEMAVSGNYLKKEGGVFEQNNVRVSSRYTLTILQGPNAGQQLLNGVLEEHIINGFGQNGIYRVWKPVPGTDGGSDPHELLAAAFNLLRTVKDYDIIQKNLALHIRKVLTAATLKSFEGTAAILQLVSTLAQWRCASNGKETMFASLANNPGVTTVEELVAVLNVYINKGLPRGESYFFPITIAVRKMLLDCANKYLSISEGIDPQRGIAAIDTTMKKLAAFMKTSDIPFSLPQKKGAY